MDLHVVRCGGGGGGDHTVESTQTRAEFWLSKLLVTLVIQENSAVKI